MADADWRAGFGVIAHSDETLARLDALLERAAMGDLAVSENEACEIFAATDRLTNAAMRIVAHMTYAHRVDQSGAPLRPEDFKREPQGHTGGSLNMAIGFAGYLAANALSGHTRAWTLGQGHCVAAIEAINTLTGDLSKSQLGRYDRSEAGQSTLANDFYSYAITPDGQPAIPLGSHVNPHTAGGLSEGGYLGFTSLQYVHMPLRGERLVAFLSDGAFEEQRGADWAPRWWRAEDCGFATPVMVLNGRRIEQRTQIGQEGGLDWLVQHLELSGFNPIIVDGHDPLSYAWGLLEADARLAAIADSAPSYPARLPYVIAPCEKGFGFPGAGANRAHNLPLDGNPANNEKARNEFNEAVRALFVEPHALQQSANTLATHASQSRPLESRNALATRRVTSPTLPPLQEIETRLATARCAMDAIDQEFVAIVKSNPKLRARVANPDELRSNHMPITLETLRHRVNAPEDGAPEAVDGAIITALNEEAVIAAALGNKGGLNLAVSYEAFAMKMLGALRQEIIFARRQKELGRDPGWISIPLIATSHTWENAKNEQSHQDPTLPEALLGEMSDTSRVIFPIDTASAVIALREVYSGHGEIACLVTPKGQTPNRLSHEGAVFGVQTGAVHLAGNPANAHMQLAALGAYQVSEAIAACNRLTSRDVPTCVTAILEPGRLRTPRDPLEAAFVLDDDLLAALFPADIARVLITHTRPEPVAGLLRRLDAGPTRLRTLGYLSRGGTFDVFGMLFANRCTWAHIVESAAALLKLPLSNFLSVEEQDALHGRGDPRLLEFESAQEQRRD
ncbi:xylulose 5-phosphate 3-epimerase [Marinicaulis aureus]|uniref:Xylulose 5-phosphate 3-epimerase n=1 Tax=Hyphococcus aureus TaxID=2666033 RepID=A0ABW1L4D6_9PROT